MLQRNNEFCHFQRRFDNMLGGCFVYLLLRAVHKLRQEKIEVSDPNVKLLVIHKPFNFCKSYYRTPQMLNSW